MEDIENEVYNMILDIDDKIINNNYKICEDEKETGSLFSNGDKKYKIPNPILEEYSIKYKPEELTDDGIPNIETQLREIREKDEEQLKQYEDNIKIYNREMIQRVKCLALNKLGKSIMTNTLDLNNNTRDKLKSIMSSYNDIDHKNIIEEFNNMVCNELFDKVDIDISKLPIYEYKS
jgi:hypothetical protein